ncbi:hypothetical protein HIM_12260 [Hirsutella minnesotensis 3608]|uniref:C2H2-type domain-containing protein n=1 Tax=Hirsutella minnesotensis 3608 TaxID=1043627 RepID=A0A0F7ZF15_9HYPO|nr:hypothetical protein HIM_12260 [Hirsutella minnesotensis 3608]
MVTCSCGRVFGSESALIQHQRDKARATCQIHTAEPSPPAEHLSDRRRNGTAWLWQGVKRQRPIRTISHAGLKASAIPVSSAQSSDVLCSYNWQTCKESAIIVPGFAAVWQDIPLPITLPKDKGNYFIDQDAAKIPQYPFETLFQATACMRHSFRFDDVDIVVNRNSLRKLLDFCCGRVKQVFRLNLSLVHNTLVIERYEKSARQLIRGSRNSGWGHAFEQAFTKFPTAIQESSGHHRVLCYALGDLRCAVRFEVDACYDQMKDESADDESSSQRLVIATQNLSLGKTNHEEEPPARAMEYRRSMPQHMAAELKTVTRSKNINLFMPQLWFGRIPWLIMGHHQNGTFTDTKVVHVEPRFEEWEASRQTELRKLVTALHSLRTAVHKGGGRNCAAICERVQETPVIRVYHTRVNARPLPNELISKFWALYSNE